MYGCRQQVRYGGNIMPGLETHGRRKFLRTTAATGSAVALGGIAGCTGFLEEETLTVAVYGGVFQDVMDEVLFEPFN
jgi:putative spermidine/putrescine transport system substrate-binding protein